MVKLRYHDSKFTSIFSPPISLIYIYTIAQENPRQLFEINPPPYLLNTAVVCLLASEYTMLLHGLARNVFPSQPLSPKFIQSKQNIRDAAECFRWWPFKIARMSICTTTKILAIMWFSSSPMRRSICCSWVVTHQSLPANVFVSTWSSDIERWS